MEPTSDEFNLDLAREDEVGLIVKSHLHIEHELMQFVEFHMPFKERCDWQRISYSGKVELALAFGLTWELKKPLQRIGKLRNDVAHSLSYRLADFDSMAFFNGLPLRFQEGSKQSYEKATGKQLKPGFIDQKRTASSADRKYSQCSQSGRTDSTGK